MLGCTSNEVPPKGLPIFCSKTVSRAHVSHRLQLVLGICLRVRVYLTGFHRKGFLNPVQIRSHDSSHTFRNTCRSAFEALRFTACASRLLRSSYSLSQVVTSLDAFLSHDWGTSRWAKMLAMMIIFNSRAAFITSMLASLVLAIWAYCDALPRRQTWTVWPPLVTFYMFLFFWQRIRLLFKPPRMVFLDKLCISQDNDELKAQGIAGLATFLLKSRKMTILWSPRYFSRLWCTYEP